MQHIHEQEGTKHIIIYIYIYIYIYITPASTPNILFWEIIGKAAELCAKVRASIIKGNFSDAA